MDVSHKGSQIQLVKKKPIKGKKKSRENSTLQSLIKVEEQDRRLIYKNYLGY